MEDLYYALNPWWEGKRFESGIERNELLRRLGNLRVRKQIEVLMGGRRMGKTTLLKQAVKQLLENGTHPSQVLYLALDHPRFTGVSVLEHVTNFRKIFGHGRSKKLFLFLDEVQEREGWESEVKALYDHENVKIILSGSTSALVLTQGGRLTGRQIITTVYPLSFREYLTFRRVRVSPSEGYLLESKAEAYLHAGGYPEQVLHPSDEYMQNLLEDALFRDIVRLFPVNKPAVLKDMIRLLAASAGSRISFNKMANILRVSLETAKEYVRYFESAFLVLSAEKWSLSSSERVYSQKKIYFLDTGMKTLLTGKGDLGAKAENAVFVHLRRREEKKGNWGYFAESEKEVDFVRGLPSSPEAVEVKYVTSVNLSDKKFSGVKLFLRKYPKTKKLTLVTKNVEGDEKIGKTVVELIPLWKFLYA